METSYYKLQYKSFPNGALSYLRQQQGWKQKPFVRKPLPYWSRVERQTFYKGFGGWTGNYQSGASSTIFIPTSPLGWSEMDQAVTKARTKFLSSIGGSAELGTAIAEWRSSLELIATRAKALREGYGHLKKGQFRKFLSTFNTRPRKKDRRKTWSRPKDASAIWIEYWFAWAPTIQDIYDSIDVIQNPASDEYVEAASGRQVTRKTSTGDPNLGASVQRTTNGVCIAKFGGAVTISNPNLYQAQQLGLINPATVLWNITPFSWFVDWFSNVGVFLEGFSDTAGLSFKQLYLTKFVKLTVDIDQNAGPPSAPGYAAKKEQVESMFMERTLISTLPMPKLKLSLPDRLSETRAATAISLLILLFTSEKK